MLFQPLATNDTGLPDIWIFHLYCLVDFLIHVKFGLQNSCFREPKRLHPITQFSVFCCWRFFCFGTATGVCNTFPLDTIKQLLFSHSSCFLCLLALTQNHWKDNGKSDDCNCYHCQDDKDFCSIFCRGKENPRFSYQNAQCHKLLALIPLKEKMLSAFYSLTELKSPFSVN